MSRSHTGNATTGSIPLYSTKQAKRDGKGLVRPLTAYGGPQGLFILTPSGLKIWNYEAVSSARLTNYGHGVVSYSTIGNHASRHLEPYSVWRSCSKPSFVTLESLASQQRGLCQVSLASQASDPTKGCLAVRER
jgi:hypothetical protein